MKKMKKKKVVSKRECVRCGSVAQFWMDFGKIGALGLCPVCWIGLTGGAYRDFQCYLDIKIDYRNEILKASKIREFYKNQ